MKTDIWSRQGKNRVVIGLLDHSIPLPQAHYQPCPPSMLADRTIGGVAHLDTKRNVGG